MTYRLRNLGLAIALAAVAVLLVFYYVSQERGRLQEDQELVPVWVAAKDIPAGTSGADLEASGYVVQSEIERSQVAPGALLEPADVSEKIVSDEIFKGEQVSQLRFRSEAEKGIRAQLTGNLRAVQLPGNQHQLLSGVLQAGDRVDVVGTWNVPEGATHHVSRVMLRDILVLEGAKSSDVASKISEGGQGSEPRGQARAHGRPGAKAPLDRLQRRLDARAAPADGRRRQPGERRELLDAFRGRPQGPADRRDRAERPQRGDGMSVDTSAPTREKARIFMTGSCDGLDQLREALERHADVELVGTSVGVAESAGTLTGGHLEAVLHGTRSSTLPRDEIASLREHTRAPIILLASGEASVLLEEALEADVSDVLLLPQMTENIVFAIRKASRNGAKAPVSAPTRRGRIVTVFSPKGGTGKTVTSTNLAAAFAKYEGKRTLLLDLDLQFGDAAIMLGLEPEKTIYDLVVAPGELDSEKLAGYTTRHASGLDILPAPVRPEDAELVTETKLSRLLEVARESYDIIVVDTSPFFHGPMLATLDRTDELLLVCGLDVPTLKNVRLALQTLELLAFPQNRIRLVLNRANSKVGMKRGEVEGALETKVRFEVPSDRAVPIAVNRGNPAVLAESGADFSKAIREMAKGLQPAEVAKGQKRGLFRKG